MKVTATGWQFGIKRDVAQPRLCALCARQKSSFFFHEPHEKHEQPVFDFVPLACADRE